MGSLAMVRTIDLAIIDSLNADLGDSLQICHESGFSGQTAVVYGKRLDMTVFTAVIAMIVFQEFGASVVDLFTRDKIYDYSDPQMYDRLKSDLIQLYNEYSKRSTH